MEILKMGVSLEMTAAPFLASWANIPLFLSVRNLKMGFEEKQGDANKQQQRHLVG